MDIKKELVEKLTKDCEQILNEKLPKALQDNNEGTYRNLVKALETNLELIDKYDFEINKDEYSVSIDYKGNCVIRVHLSKPNVTRTNVEEIFNQIVHDAKWLK